jgi:hypothetical protein
MKENAISSDNPEASISDFFDGWQRSRGAGSDQHTEWEAATEYVRLGYHEGMSYI